MEYSIYKLDFQTGVHFGTGMLNESAYTFQADQLFSAMFIEALKMQKEKEFLDMTQRGNLLFSDAFPYIGQQYMVPKPMIYIEPQKKGQSEQKKAYKKLKFLPIEQLENFMNGTMDVSVDPLKEYGSFQQQTMARVRTEEDTLPFRVGTYFYYPDCGLYIILGYTKKEEKYLAEELLESLEYTGIGGKKSTGLGKYILRLVKLPEVFERHLKKDADRIILLSVGLPRDGELENALEGASYQLIRRSGFISSDTYAEELRKKKDLYVFAAGSCFEHRFEGDIYDVSDNGSHPVYRYAKPLFMGV